MAGKVKPPTRPVVVTANRLSDGTVVWLTAQNDWAEDVSQAQLFEPAAAEAGLAAGRRDEARQLIVASYAAEAEATEHGPRPLHSRERIRAFGPTIAYLAEQDT